MSADQMQGIERCGVMCEMNLRWEAQALAAGRLQEAAEYAEAAEAWAVSAHGWAVMA